MNRPSRFTFFAVAAIAVLLAAFGHAFFAVARAGRNQRAEVTMKETVGSIRRLQNATRALQTERATTAVLRTDWERARALFRDQLDTLRGHLASLDPAQPQIERIAHTWGRMEDFNGTIGAALADLETKGTFASRGTTSLLLSYEERLLDPASPGAEVGELGKVLFELEQVDRLINEVELEMGDLVALLEQRTRGASRDSLLAAIGGSTVALLLILFLLYRMARLYTSLQADNAARRVAEQAARASEADLAITLDAIGEAVISTDTEGRIVRVNPAAAQLLEFPSAQLLGRPVREVCRLVDPERKTALGQPVDAVLTTGRDFAPAGHLMLQRPDGSLREVAVLASPILGDTRQTRGAVFVLRDVTATRQLEDQLRHAQRVESLGKLAGGVAHDFNNILQVVRANVGLLAMDTSLPPESRLLVTQIDEASGRAAELTRQLLALGRRQTLQVRELDPDALVLGMLKLARRVIGETIEISYFGTPDHDWVRADPGQIEQVVLNLCVNARDAMPRGGRLTLTIENVTLAAGQRAGDWSRPGKFVRLSVADTGTGMTPDTLAHIFEPFFTTKETGRGTGLGLSVVQGIVHQHGGFLDVLSAPGRGTTFFVYLPRCDRPRAAPAAAATPAAGLPVAHGETVLIVEDDAAVRRVAEAVLRRQGYRVLIAGDGEEGCRVGELNRDEIAVALLDVVMPRLGGPDAARRLQQTIPGLPVVLCTGYAGGIEVPELSDGTGWQLLNKPYSTEALVTVVRHAIESRRETKR